MPFALKDTRKKAAPVPDGITYATVANIGTVIAVVLLRLLNKVWEQ